jgi:hypothetical protein
MTRPHIIIAVLMVGGFAHHAFAQALHKNWVILPESEGINAVSQCSRVSPDRVTAFWTPSVEQVMDVEQRLPALLKNSGHKIYLSRFARQYIGVISRGRRLIYVNAFSESLAAELETDWRKKAFIVCDGGDAFWGVAFDPATHKFLYLGFNGLA